MGAVKEQSANFYATKMADRDSSPWPLICLSGAIEREFYEFYRTPRGEFTPQGASPLTTTHPTLSSNVKFMNFYPFNDIETISPRPMLFITGD